MYIPGQPFKYISGLVRRKESTPETEQLRGFIFDAFTPDVDGQDFEPFVKRMIPARATFDSAMDSLVHVIVPLVTVGFTPGGKISVPLTVSTVMGRLPEWAEGIVVRDPNGIYEVGKRRKDMLKCKRTNTFDLRVASFEEAVSKDGTPLGMVGRINVLYAKGIEDDGKNQYTDFVCIGAGPGKLTHKERKEIWENREAYIGKTAEIAAMPDDSYDALREARFTRWRPDKDD